MRLQPSDSRGAIGAVIEEVQETLRSILDEGTMG